MTAHEVVAASRLLHTPTTPWDKVSGGHFVARCSYSSPAAIGMSPTTICKGEPVSLYRPTQIFADEDRRTSPDDGFESLPSPALC